MFYYFWKNNWIAKLGCFLWITSREKSLLSVSYMYDHQTVFKLQFSRGLLHHVSYQLSLQVLNALFSSYTSELVIQTKTKKSRRPQKHSRHISQCEDGKASLRQGKQTKFSYPQVKNNPLVSPCYTKFSRDSCPNINISYVIINFTDFSLTDQVDGCWWKFLF